MLRLVDEDEEIKRAIKRDPRFLIRIVVLLVLMLVLIGVGLISVGKLGLGRRTAEGFATITEVPPPTPSPDASRPPR